MTVTDHIVMSSIVIAEGKGNSNWYHTCRKNNENIASTKGAQESER